MHTDLPPASLLRRLAAIFYDLLVLVGILMATSFALIAARDGVAIPAGSTRYQLFLAAQVAGYFLLSWHHGGQTIGMRAWRISVVSATGDPLTWARAALRLAAAVGSAAALGLGFLWQLVDAREQTWHDLLTGTRVVRLPGRARGGDS